MIFFKFSPSSLLIILYKLTKFEAPSCNDFWDIKFSMSKFAEGNNSTKNDFFFLFSSGNLLIILYKLIKFEAPSCYSFWNSLITKFHMTL